MVLGSTILAVRDALASMGQASLSDIAAKVDMERNTVRETLNLLVHLGIVERIEHGPTASRKKNGWITVEYKAIAAKTIAIENEG